MIRKPEIRPLTEEIYEHFEILAPVAKRLGSHEELNRIKDIVEVGPSFKRQRAVFKETGDYQEVMKAVGRELRENIKITA